MPPNHPVPRQNTTAKRSPANQEAPAPKLTDTRAVDAPEQTKIKPRPFLQRLIDAANDQALTDFEFRLLVTMAADARGEDGVAFGAVARYAKRCGDRTRRGIQKARARLKTLNLLDEPNDHKTGSTETRRFRITPVGWSREEDVEKRKAEAAQRNAETAREAVQLTFNGRAALSAVPAPTEPEDADPAPENIVPMLPNLDTERVKGGEPPFAPPANEGSPPREPPFAPPANEGSPQGVQEGIQEEAAVDIHRTRKTDRQQQQQQALEHRIEGLFGAIASRARKLRKDYDEADERNRLAGGEIGVDDLQRLADKLADELAASRKARL